MRLRAQARSQDPRGFPLGRKIWFLIFSKQFHVITIYLIRNQLALSGPRILWKCLHVPLEYFSQVYSGCDIGEFATLETPIYMPHPTGIVIGYGAKVGSGTWILQNVTLGKKNLDDPETDYPTIGRNCTISAGAVILGKITIGDNCVIGANSVVTKDIPDDSIAVGAPARIIGTRKHL